MEYTIKHLLVKVDWPTSTLYSTIVLDSDDIKVYIVTESTDRGPAMSISNNIETIISKIIDDNFCRDASSVPWPFRENIPGMNRPFLFYEFYQGADRVDRVLYNSDRKTASWERVPSVIHGDAELIDVVWDHATKEAVILKLKGAMW